MTDDLKSLRMAGTSGFHDYFVVDVCGDYALGLKALAGCSVDEGSFVGCRFRASAHPNTPGAPRPKSGWHSHWTGLTWVKHGSKHSTGLAICQLQNALPAVMLHEIKKVDIASIVANRLSLGLGKTSIYSPSELAALLQAEWIKLLKAPDEGELPDDFAGKPLIDLDAVLKKKPEPPPIA
ncbi:hypothetical protein [Roseococcus pinisoli]|uniref:Uncharacterized protein n=1 Tax=Roseococcus pinisoli TaxID=2835040 RepID=A0ABS5QF82_9PROT|nr:hypothetical protein [Roseococcus pinisoli]MBS7812331.1 hypothetical protein [Roseococcus pinisoli]